MNFINWLGLTGINSSGVDYLKIRNKNTLVQLENGVWVNLRPRYAKTTRTEAGVKIDIFARPATQQEMLELKEGKHKERGWSKHITDLKSEYAKSDEAEYNKSMAEHAKAKPTTTSGSRTGSGAES